MERPLGKMRVAYFCHPHFCFYPTVQSVSESARALSSLAAAFYFPLFTHRYDHSSCPVMRRRRKPRQGLSQYKAEDRLCQQQYIRCWRDKFVAAAAVAAAVGLAFALDRKVNFRPSTSHCPTLIRTHRQSKHSPDSTFCCLPSRPRDSRPILCCLPTRPTYPLSQPDFRL